MRNVRILLAIFTIPVVLSACGQTPVAPERTAPDPRTDGGPFLGGGNVVDSTQTNGSTGPFLGGGN